MKRVVTEFIIWKVVFIRAAKVFKLSRSFTNLFWMFCFIFSFSCGVFLIAKSITVDTYYSRGEKTLRNLSEGQAMRLFKVVFTNRFLLSFPDLRNASYHICFLMGLPLMDLNTPKLHLSASSNWSPSSKERKYDESLPLLSLKKLSPPY